MLTYTRLIGAALALFVAMPAAAQVTAVRAGRLIDPEAPAAFFHGGPVNGWRIR